MRRRSRLFLFAGLTRVRALVRVRAQLEYPDELDREIVKKRRELSVGIYNFPEVLRIRELRTDKVGPG
eukprot:21683-Eustigmatos_ZCMA.PRE.1